MKTPYSFSVIRYVHDVVGGEFVNVGVTLYAPDMNFVDAICTKKYARLSSVFVDVDGSQFRSLMNFIEIKIIEFRQRLESELQFDGKPKDVFEILSNIIPPDDSSLQFSKPGGGFTNDAEKTLEELYDRYVERYVEKPITKARDDEEVWKTFKKPLEEKHVLKYLRAVTIVNKNRDYEYEFKHAWKNNHWRTLEPVSFDLEDARSIPEKATRWVGRATVLADARERFHLYLLVGKPRQEKLMNAYSKAENILHKIKVPHDFVKEDEAEDFAQSLRSEIKNHSEE